MEGVYQEGAVRIPYDLARFYRGNVEYARVTVIPAEATVSGQLLKRLNGKTIPIIFEEMVMDMPQEKLEVKIGRALKSFLKV